MFAFALTAGAFAASSGVVTEDVVNARKGPGTSYEVVEMLARGKQVSIVGEEGGWYKVKWNDSTGYILKDYIATNGGASASTAQTSGSAASSANATITGGSTINVRSGPGTEHSRVAMVGAGKRVTVMGTSGDWYHISFDGKTGYVLCDYLIKDGSNAPVHSNQTGSQSTETAANTAASANATVTGGSTINLRSAPSTSAERVMLLAEGKRVAVLEQSGEWYKISVDGKTGYIYGDFIRRDGAAAASNESRTGNATVKDNNVNVRAAASTSANRIASVSSGKRVTLLEKDGGWYKVSFDDKTGYIYGDYITADNGVLASLPTAQHEPEPAPAAEPAPQEMEQAGEETGPDEAAIPAAAVETSAVEAGSTAGVSADGSAGIITGGTINVRSGPGTDHERLTQVTTGKKVTILGALDGWTHISFGNTEGYVLSDYVCEGDTLPESEGGVGAQVAVMAPQYLGVRYVYGGSSPSGFDCSGFTMYLYKQFGYSLPHTASGQYANCGYKVSRSDLQPGDLVFFSSPSSGGRINHVGVYVGNGNVVHARYSIGKVYTNSLSESYYSKYYVGAVRIA